MRLLDPKFEYVPSSKTNVAATWRRFGFRPTTDAERRARQMRAASRRNRDEIAMSAMMYGFARNARSNAAPLEVAQGE